MKVNKRGDIPVTILVIGVFAVCSLALLSFYISDIKTGNSFIVISSVEKMNSQIEQYSCSYNLNADFDKEGNFYQEEKVWHWYTFWKKEKLLISVKHPK